MVPEDDEYVWYRLTHSELDFSYHPKHRNTLLQSFLMNSGLTLDSLPITDAVEVIRERMLEHFRVAIPKTRDISLSSLDLAITFFRNIDHGYKVPRQGLPYTECLQIGRFFPVPRHVAGNDPPFDPCPNFSNHCMFDIISSAVTAQIITACGLDPATCTHATLEVLDPFVVCLSCPGENDSNDFQPTMRWTQGVRFKCSTISTRLADL